MLKLFFCTLVLVVGVENSCTPKHIEKALSGFTTTVNRKLVSGPSECLWKNSLTIFSKHGKDLEDLHGRNSRMLSDESFRTTLDGGDEARTALAIGLKATLKVVKGIEILIGAMCLKALLKMKNYLQRPIKFILGLGSSVIAVLFTLIVLLFTEFLVSASTLTTLYNYVNSMLRT